MAFTRTAQYRTANFDQGDEIEYLKTNLFNGYTSMSKGLDSETSFGVCLALCILWINNKVLAKKQRVIGPEARMKTFKDGFGEAIYLQKQVTAVWKQHGGALKAVFQDDGVMAPQPVTQIAPEGSALNADSVIVNTLPFKVPYVMIYRWSPDKAHAIVLYRTTKRSMIIDPNCGEMACVHTSLGTMWRAYWDDVTETFTGMPGTYGLAALGVDPHALPGPKKEQCLLATAACAQLGLTDDCEELQLLRRYRDDVLARSAAGRRSIARYYARAPAAIARIQADPICDRKLREVYEQIVAPAAQAIRENRHEDARLLFHSVLNRMKNPQNGG